MKSNDYLVSLTSLRGVAAWLVVFYHFKLYLLPYLSPLMFDVVSHGYLAVDLFFIMSGYIISYNYSNSFNNTNSLLFLVKRFARIFPLHIFILLIYLTIPLAIMLFSSEYSVKGSLPSEYTVGNFILNLALVQVWVLNAESLNVPSWSISVEWFCYLVFPILSFVSTKVKDNIWGVFFLFAIVICLAEIITAFNSPELVSVDLIRGWCEFTCGCLLCRMRDRGISYFFLLLTFIAILAYSYFSKLHFQYMIYIPIFSFLILFVSYKNLVSKFLSWKVLEFNGDISYSVYLVHYYFYEIFKMLFLNNDSNYVSIYYVLMTFILIFFVSVFTYKYIEIPARLYLTRIGQSHLEGFPSVLSFLQSITLRR